jgi:aminoglycoside 6'-N-acetyltransferase
MLAMGTPQAICRIIEAPAPAQPGAPAAGSRWLAVGYAHALDAVLVGPPRLDVLPPGSWQVDVFVASPEHRGRGIGGMALLLIRDEVFDTTLALAAAAYVSVGNEKAVRAYEQAGFKWRAIARDAVRGAEWLMLADRAGRNSEGRRPHGDEHGAPGGTPRLL